MYLSKMFEMPDIADPKYVYYQNVPVEDKKLLDDYKATGYTPKQITEMGEKIKALEELLSEIENFSALIKKAGNKKGTPRKIRVCFELTMPNKGSWDGKWTGEIDKHYVFKEFSPAYFKKNESKIIGSWYYSWNDGWGANITSTVIDAEESRKRKKINKGFCGYGWMVDSILIVGEILNEADLKSRLADEKSNLDVIEKI